jgi:endonuclease/exonuclease/phosphatase family metal-dependent hydrolase
MARDRISFATFNLLNFQEAGRPMNRGQAPWTPEQVEAKVAWTAAMLRRAEADVIGFQELGAARPSTRPGAGGARRHPRPPRAAGSTGGRIDCAAAVRRDLLAGSPEWIEAFPPVLRLETEGEDAQTPLLAVRIDAFSRPSCAWPWTGDGPHPIAVHVCHLKSKRPTEVRGEGWFDPDLHGAHATALGSALSTIRRTAEAAALRVILTDGMKGTAVPTVVMGDLNDGEGGPVLAIATEEPPFLWPQRRGGRDTALYSGQGMQQAQSQRDVYFTYIHEEVHSSLDHVLVSREFYSQSTTRVWALDGLDIWNDHLNVGAAERTAGANDHGVVRARFSRPR